MGGALERKQKDDLRAAAAAASGSSELMATDAHGVAVLKLTGQSEATRKGPQGRQGLQKR